MTQFYDGLKDTIIGWVFNGSPSNMTLRVAALTDEYVFDASHEDVSSLTGGVFDENIPNLVVTNGVIDGDDIYVNDLTPGPTIYSFVVYFDWEVGTKLVLYIDGTTDESLPQLIEGNTCSVVWNPAGIFKI